MLRAVYYDGWETMGVLETFSGVPPEEYHCN